MGIAVEQAAQALSNENHSNVISHLLQINFLVLYNVCVMAYQTQQYGKVFQYSDMILLFRRHAEDFIVFKTLFLLLQVLFELRMVQPAWPIIKFLVKKLGVVQESLKTLKFSQDQKQQEKNPDSTMN